MNSDSEYGVLDAYDDPENYVPDRYRDRIGRYLESREKKIFDKFIAEMTPNDVLLDCPHGMGRLTSLFHKKDLQVLGVDVSREMLGHSRKSDRSPEQLAQARSEYLPLEDDCVDWAFSFALMKHLPVIYQEETLAELARVARKGVVASFTTFNVLSFLQWWVRLRPNSDEGYPVPPVFVERMANRNDLRVEWSERVFPVIGLEEVYFFRPQ